MTNHDLTRLSLTHAIVIGTTKSIERKANYKACFYELIDRLGRAIGRAPVSIQVERDELIPMIRKVHDALGETIHLSIENIVVDASVFPKDRLWVLLDYLHRVNSGASLYVLYTEPSSYDTETPNLGWLSKGVKRLVSIPGFNGRQNSSRKTLLVVIVGHEQERMQITIRNTEPSKVLLIGQGTEQYRDDAPRLSDFIVGRLGQDYAHVIDFGEKYVAGSRDYLAVRDAIREIYNRHKDAFNIIVAANSTKLQSIGALMACREHRAINAIYAEPQLYNSEMTNGIGRIWAFGL
ncbi:MAG: DUF6293 family protein [Sterolibacteriaceae bacterium MAG5]|nr:DUF6293 family protein [Candidatus Nitricoxidireducens bremensis]